MLLEVNFLCINPCQTNQYEFFLNETAILADGNAALLINYVVCNVQYQTM